MSFVDVINKWINVMNSYTQFVTIVTKMPYGENHKFWRKQNKFLEQCVQDLKIHCRFFKMKLISRPQLYKNCSQV